MNSAELTLEQQFKLKVLENHIQSLSQQQVQKLLLKAVQQNMIQDNVIKRSQIEERTPLNINC